MTDEKTAPPGAEQSPASPGRRAFVKKAYLAPTIILLELGTIRNVSAQSCCPVGDECGLGVPPCPPGGGS